MNTDDDLRGELRQFFKCLCACHSEVSRRDPRNLKEAAKRPGGSAIAQGARPLPGPLGDSSGPSGARRNDTDVAEARAGQAPGRAKKAVMSCRAFNGPLAIKCRE